VFRGPGGHSFQAFGIVNPAYAMSRAIVELGRMKVPQTPRTTFCASIVRGGTSINAIPAEVSVDIDLRSESAAELARVDDAFRTIVAAAVEEENAARSTADGRIAAELVAVGDRPAGATPSNSDIVRYAAAAIAAQGIAAEEEASSTDANLPMSLGIPAIKMGSGGSGGRAHSLEEWIDVEKAESLRGMTAGLATILAVAGFLPSGA
jgi:acetylornithine deacetylase/succinyl-diaminopimelate desuccinylase-like protein